MFVPSIQYIAVMATHGHPLQTQHQTKPVQQQKPRNLHERSVHLLQCTVTETQQKLYEFHYCS